jgi:hypothetical protein
MSKLEAGQQRDNAEAAKEKKTAEEANLPQADFRPASWRSILGITSGFARHPTRIDAKGGAYLQADFRVVRRL